MKTSIRFSGLGKHIVSVALSASLLAVMFIATPVQAAPTVTIIPSTGAAGTVTTISGSVFDSYKGDNIFILFNGVEIPGSPFIVPQTGEFSIDYVVPESLPPGIYRVLASTTPQATLVIADAFFTVEQTKIYLEDRETLNGPVGTTITITGTGFYAGATVDLFYDNPSPIQAGEVKASAQGRFDFNYVIPEGIAGNHVMTATNVYGDQAIAYFQVVPRVTLNMNSGGPGEILNITGTGFGRVKNFSVMMGTNQVASGTTNELGGFDFGFYIPNIKANPYDVIVTDAENHTDTVKFTVTAGAALSMKTGPIGSELTVRGDGFTPASTITVMFDTMTMQTLTSNNDGGFVSTFTVPSLASGTYDITISDGTTSKVFTFDIESDPPAAPVLLLPANSTQTGSLVTFDWEDVTDASLPVTYQLQVAYNNDFASIILEDSGFEASGYTAGEDVFTTGNASVTYYWRVRAQDGALNDSDWSTPWSFFISPPESPVLSDAVVNDDNDTISLDWDDVVTPGSSITYALEISDEMTFENTVISRTGIATSGTTVSGEDYSELKNNTTYYWRVRATDSVMNESGWSDTGSFRIERASSGFPLWGIIAIAGIGIIIIAYLAFRMGRKSAYETQD